MRIAAFVIAALLGAVAGLWTWTRAGEATPPGPDAVAIQIVDNGFHTDFVVPRAVLDARAGPLGEAVRGLPSGDWVLIGWGDAIFYVDQSPIHHRLPDGARAFFRPGNASVVMLDPAQDDPGVDYAADRRRIVRLAPADLVRMLDRVERSLALVDGRAIVTVTRAGDDARFFASTETFNILHLCNHWTAEVLNAAGLTVRPLRAITSAEVMATVDRADARKLDLRPRGD